LIASGEEIPNDMNSLELSLIVAWKIQFYCFFNPKDLLFC
jgi:hypothetical protein